MRYGWLWFELYLDETDLLAWLHDAGFMRFCLEKNLKQKRQIDRIDIIMACHG